MLPLSLSAQVTSGASYSLIARHSGLALDASAAGTANGTSLIQSTPHGGSNQVWTVNSLGSGQYNLIGAGSGRAVEIYGASQADNAGANLYDWDGGNNQKVTLQSAGGGYYTLLFVHSGKALTVQSGSTASGAAVVQATNNGSQSAQWLFAKGPAGYIWCSGENGTRSFGQSVDLAYGADGQFNYHNGVSGSRSFGNSTFGDPVPNVVKSGYYKVASGGGPDGYALCSAENGTFTFHQPVNVAYGSNGNFSYQSGVSGTITFSNATFGDPNPGVVKAGYFQVIPQAPPSPSSLSAANLNTFIANHAKYNGGSASAYSAYFQDFLQKMGGNVFCAKLYASWPNTMLDITSAYSGAAASSGGNTVYSKAFWDGSPDRRVPTLMHEYIHHMDNGSGVSGYYNAAVADPLKQWDSYAMTSQAEYIASGFEWIVGNNMHSASENNRQVIYRMDPAFYLYMVNTFIPNFFQ